jgi:hypothetical protein
MSITGFQCVAVLLEKTVWSWAKSPMVDTKNELGGFVFTTCSTK